MPRPAGRPRHRAAGPRRRRAADARADRGVVPAGVSAGDESRGRARRRPTTARCCRWGDSDWPSPPTRSSSARCSSPAATSASWPSTARSTTWPWPGPSRLALSAGFILEEGLPMETLRRVVGVDARRGPTRSACGSSPATPRSSTAARATASSSTRPGIGLVPEGVEISPAASCRATRSWSAATWAGTASPSCRSARGCASKARCRATARRWPGWSRRCWPPGADLHCLRDLTRGGLAAALNEIAEHARRGNRARRGGDPRGRAGGRRLRTAGARPALRGQRGPAGGLRARPRPPSDVLQTHAPHPAAPGPAIIGSVVADTRAPSNSAASWAAAASSICSPASKCRGSVSQRFQNGGGRGKGGLNHPVPPPPHPAPPPTMGERVQGTRSSRESCTMDTALTHVLRSCFRRQRRRTAESLIGRQRRVRLWIRRRLSATRSLFRAEGRPWHCGEHDRCPLRDYAFGGPFGRLVYRCGACHLHPYGDHPFRAGAQLQGPPALTLCGFPLRGRTGCGS